MYYEAYVYIYSYLQATMKHIIQIKSANSSTRKHQRFAALIIFLLLKI